MNRIRFIYLDYWAGHGPWRRIKVKDVEERAKKSKFFNIYTSAQRFESPQHLDGELTWAPLYFDFDNASDPGIAKEEAKKVFQFFTQLGINKEFIHIYFSGNKGFHIIIEPEIFGIEPHPELAYVMKQIGYYLKDFLKLNTLDIQVYSIRRLIRLHDSVHQKSGKYKIELHPDELDFTMEKILELATAPRGELYESIEYTEIEANETAKMWYNGFSEQYKNEEVLHKLKPRNVINKTKEHPACISFLLNQVTLPTSNTGNRSTLALASYFKDIGKKYEEAEKEILEWLSKVNNCGDANSPEKIKSMVTSTTKFVFEPENSGNYHFACSFIRALGSNETKIPCQYDKCPLIKNPTDQEPEIPIELHLSEASRAEYKDHKLFIKAMVAGKDGAPYIIPKEITASCVSDDKSDCGACALKDCAEYNYEFTAKDSELLEFINIKTSEIAGPIKKKLRCGSCRSCVIDIKSNFNMETIRLVPLVDDSKYGAQQHVTRVCYYLGHGIGLNQKYKVTAYTYTDPRSQHATHLISELDQYNSSLNNFKMSPELRNQLLVFQPRSRQTIWSKFDEIHDDLEANVYKIWHRRIMAFGVDLIYHSALNFYFQNQLLQRGWCEVLIVGDSGQGKTQLMDRINGHYKLGEGASGESSKRTGLIYNFQETQHNWMLQWGRIPLNDRGLFYIDEFSALSTEDIGQMSYMRSTGKIVLRGIITDETNARTRLIFLTNPRNGRSLNSFNHGVESIAGVIPQVEDIRRLDFALTVASGEVPLESLNRSDMPKVEHVFTSYLCEQLILWAWSRKPDDIVITPEAEKAILENSIEMSKKYYAKIPLVEPADQRIKMARLSVAIACRLFSCDETGEKVIVKSEHVHFIYDYLTTCYDQPSMGYDNFSKEEKSKSEILPDKEASLKDDFAGFKDPARLKEILLRTTYISRSLMEDMLGYSREETKDVLRFLMVNNLIDHKKHGWIKTPHFISFLKSLKDSDLVMSHNKFLSEES